MASKLTKINNRPVFSYSIRDFVLEFLKIMICDDTISNYDYYSSRRDLKIIMNAKSIDDISRFILDIIPCSGLEITSLEGCPKYYNGNFNCSHNLITSLAGSPEIIIDGNFDCSDNKLVSLEGAPRKIINGICNFVLNEKLSHVQILGYNKYLTLDDNLDLKKSLTKDGHYYPAAWGSEENIIKYLLNN